MGEAYSLTGTRSGEGEKMNMIDLEMQRRGSLAFRQRANIYASALFHECLAEGEII